MNHAERLANRTQAFAKARRSLLGTSMALLVFTLAGGQLPEKLEIQGGEVVIGNPERLIYFAWAILMYFWIRVYQLQRGIGGNDPGVTFISGFNNSCRRRVNELVFRRAKERTEGFKIEGLQGLRIERFARRASGVRDWVSHPIRRTVEVRSASKRDGEPLATVDVDVYWHELVRILATEIRAATIDSEAITEHGLPHLLAASAIVLSVWTVVRSWQCQAFALCGGAS